MNEKYTDWFPGTIKPVRVGVYRRYADFPFFALWDGTQWMCAGPTIPFAARDRNVSFNQTKASWRGLRAGGNVQITQADIDDVTYCRRYELGQDGSVKFTRVNQ